MSYILDALQRADAERARGGVPTLNARPLSSPVPQGRLNSRQRIGLSLAAVAAVCAVAVGWWLWPTPRVADVAPAVPRATPPATTPLPAPAVMLQPKPETNEIVPHAPPPPQAATIPVKPAAPQSPAQPVAGPGQAKPAIIIPAAEAAVATPSLAPLLSELPEALRRQIPAMAITGAVNSDNPAQRLLLVNGQVLNQGSQVAPDLTVVEIRSGFSEFNFRGSHFRMAH